MGSTATMVVTALINQARQRHGRVEAIEVPATLHEQLMDEMVQAGRAVGFDSCDVDGVRVLAGGTPDGVPLVRTDASSEPQPLDGTA